MPNRYEEYFGEENRYKPMLNALMLDRIIAVNDESVCLTITKHDWHITHVWSMVMLDTLDDDTLKFSIDTHIIAMIAELCERILNETQFQKN